MLRHLYFKNFMLKKKTWNSLYLRNFSLYLEYKISGMTRPLRDLNAFVRRFDWCQPLADDEFRANMDMI